MTAPPLHAVGEEAEAGLRERAARAAASGNNVPTPDETPPSSPSGAPNPNAPNPNAPNPGAPMSHAEIRTVFFGLMLATFLAALNQTIVATALPTMGRHFGDFENLSWLVTAYLLTSTAAAPLYGKLSDIYGRRRMMLMAIGIFVAGSVTCALAPSMGVLIIGRAIQGMGGGGILPLTQAIIADVVSPRERGRYQAYMGVVWVTSGVGGPVLGGAMAEHLHWSLIFWINLPLGLIAALLTYKFLARIPRHERRRKLDLLGALLMMASAMPILLALTWGGARYPWLSWQILGLVAASMVLTLLFAWRLMRAPEPFLPLAVLRNPVMRMGTTCASFAMGTSIGLTIFIPLYLETVHKLTAAQSGLALIPIALTTPGSLLSGQVMVYCKRYKWMPISGLICGIAAMACLAWWPAMPLWHAIALMSVVGTATGTVYPVTTVSIQNAVPHHQVGIAMGALNFFRSLASAFIVAIMGAILLAGFGATASRGTDISVLAESVGRLGVEIAPVFGMVFLASLIFMVISLVFLILMEERPLRGASSGDPPAAPQPAPVPPPAAAP